MALINRPMYEQFGARHLAVKGPGALTQLEEGVMGVLPLDLSSDFAYWHIQGFRTFSKNVFQAGVAGQFPAIGLSLEGTDDQWLSRIISIDVSQMAVPAGSDIGLFRCARTAFSSDPGIIGTSTDTRVAEAQPSQSILLNGNHAANPGTQLGLYHTFGDPDWFSQNRIPLLVSPGEVIYIASPVAGGTLVCTWTWVEIPAYRAEL